MPYGKISLSFDPSFKWRRMSKPSTQYAWPNGTTATHRAYTQEAIDLAVEYRRALGYDSALTCSGPLAYVVDTTISGTFGPIQVLPFNTTDPINTSAVMSAGQTLTYQNISEKCVSLDAKSTAVEITRP